MKTLLALLLLIPNFINAKFSFDETPSFQEELTLIKIKVKNEGWGFRDWNEMQKDPDVEVEDYRAFIGARCGGLYQARIETFHKNTNNENLNARLLAMNELIDNNSLDIYTDIVSEDAKSWGYFRKHMYKGYYIELYNFSKKYDFKLESLSQDRGICEKEFENYFS